MKTAVIFFAIGICASAMGSYFSVQSMKTTIEGTECIVVKHGSSVGVSCNWK